MKLNVLIRVAGVFLIVLIVFVGIGYFFYNSLSEPTNIIIFLILANFGLVMGVVVSRKFIPKKTLPYKQPSETDNPD